MKRSSISLFLIMCMSFTGCSFQPVEPPFAQAEILCEEKRFEEAVELIKQYLVKNPSDFWGHLKLAQTYKTESYGNEILIEGEAKTALMLYKKKGARIPQFEFESHLLFAELVLERIRLSTTSEIEKEHLNKEFAEHIAVAKEIHPDSSRIQEIEAAFWEIKTKTDKKKQPGLLNFPSVEI